MAEVTTDLTEEFFKDLHRDYNSIKLYLRKLKFETATEAGQIGSTEEARAIAAAMVHSIEEKITSNNPEYQFYYRLVGMRSTLMCDQSKLYSSDERLITQDLLSTALNHLLDGSLKPEITFILLRVINQLSYFLSVYEEYDNAQILLEQGEKIYNLLKENSNIVVTFYTGDDLFVPSLSLAPHDETNEQLERLVTNNLQMLGFVYSKLGRDDLFAWYQHRVLDRQLMMMEGEALSWAVRAAKLGRHFLTKNQFREARNHLAAACMVLSVYEEDLMAMPMDEAVVAKFEEVSASGADIGRAWVTYGLQLATASVKDLIDQQEDEDDDDEEDDDDGSDEDYYNLDMIGAVAATLVEGGRGDEPVSAQKTKDVKDEKEKVGEGEKDVTGQDKAKVVDQGETIAKETDDDVNTSVQDKDKVADEGDKVADEGDKVADEGDTVADEGDKVADKGDEVAESLSQTDQASSDSAPVKDGDRMSRVEGGDPAGNTEQQGEAAYKEEGGGNILEGKENSVDKVVEKVVQVVAGQVAEKAAGEGTDEVSGEAMKDPPPQSTPPFDLTFSGLDLSRYELAVPCSAPFSHPVEAQQLVAHVEPWHSRAVRYYHPRRNPMEYAELALDWAETLRCATMHEADRERKYRAHRTREEMLETACDSLRASSVACFQKVSFRFYRDLADVHMELMGLNLSRFYESHELYSDTEEEGGEEEEEEEGVFVRLEGSEPQSTEPLIMVQMNMDGEILGEEGEILEEEGEEVATTE